VETISHGFNWFFYPIAAADKKGIDEVIDRYGRLANQPAHRFVYPQPPHSIIWKTHSFISYLLFIILPNLKLLLSIISFLLVLSGILKDEKSSPQITQISLKKLPQKYINFKEMEHLFLA